LGAYHWNSLICQLLYPFIESVEIVLRNAIHNGASKKFRTVNWFDIVIVDGKTKMILDETKKSLKKRKKHFNAADIVSNLTLGFWVTLIRQRTYANQFNENRLWPDLIPVVFPNFARANNERQNIAKRFEEIKIIRNRLFHHEPIWKFKHAQTEQQCIVQLRRKFNDILKAIGWISKNKKDALRDFGFVTSFKEHCSQEILDQYKLKGLAIIKKYENFTSK